MFKCRFYSYAEFVSEFNALMPYTIDQCQFWIGDKLMLVSNDNDFNAMISTNNVTFVPYEMQPNLKNYLWRMIFNLFLVNILYFCYIACKSPEFTVGSIQLDAAAAKTTAALGHLAVDRIDGIRRIREDYICLMQQML